jgi:sarcosine oxidase subunit beta
VIRSNYLLEPSMELYDFALRRWEELQAELDLDFSFDQCGVLSLAHSDHEARDMSRRIHANRLAGIDAQWLEGEELAAFSPLLNLSPAVRHPVVGAMFQGRGGIARHDALALAYARAADQLGVHLLDNTPVSQIIVRDGAVRGIQTDQGIILADTVALATAGGTTALTAPLGLRLPLQCRALQALVSELFEPVLDHVVMSSTVHVYLSQADKGEFVLGAGVDRFNSYAQRGSFDVIEQQLAAALELFPMLARARVVRTWAGTVDVTPDASPILEPTAVEGLYLNCGWGTGGFKATPGVGVVYADMLANRHVHPLAIPFSSNRFNTGALVDEHHAAGVAH